jgi:hypothetical protein
MCPEVEHRGRELAEWPGAAPENGLARVVALLDERAGIADLPADPQSIYDVVLVGNSTMRDLFFRQSVYSIGQNPYRSITEIEMAEGKRATTSLTTTGRRWVRRCGCIWDREVTAQAPG